MKKIRNALAVIAVFFLFCVGTAAPAWSQDDKAAAGLEASDAWILLVDQEDYAKSWENAAEYFKNAVDQAKWEQTLNSVRKPLGAMQTRELIKTAYSKTMPGAPDGEYVVVQYQTSFENKESAVETVIQMLDKDGSWRVAGYYIK